MRYRNDELQGQRQRALDNGVTEEDIKGLVTSIAFYAGWRAAVNAGRLALEAINKKQTEDTRQRRHWVV